MLTKSCRFARCVANRFRFRPILLVTTGFALAVVAGLVFPAPAFAQQRIIVEKATGNVVDVGDSRLEYDKRYFDHFDYPGEAIPSGADFRKYMRDARGAIILRPKEELLSDFEDERRNDLIARINAALLTPELKELLLEIVKMRSNGSGQ